MYIIFFLTFYVSFFGPFEIGVTQSSASKRFRSYSVNVFGVWNFFNFLLVLFVFLKFGFKFYFIGRIYYWLMGTLSTGPWLKKLTRKNKIIEKKRDILFNQTCLNNNHLPKYTLSLYIYIYVCVCVCVCTRVCVRVCVCVRAHTHIYVQKCIYACLVFKMPNKKECMTFV